MKSRVLVINLERRPDRLKQFAAAVHQAAPQLSVVRYDAVDGAQLQRTQFLSDLFRNNDFGYRAAVVGCALTHLELWHRLLAEPLVQAYLVFEDDVQFADHFLQQFTALLKELPVAGDGSVDLDFLFLGGMQPGQRITDRCASCAPGVGYGTTAYLVTKGGASKAIELARRNGMQRAVDWFLIDHFTELRALVATPWLAKGPLGADTDIQRSFTPLSTPSATTAPREKVRVRAVCDWCSPAELRELWNKMSRGDATWGGVSLAEPEGPYDLTLVVNRCDLRSINDQMILLLMEPESGRRQWGLWARPEPRHFRKVFGHGDELNTVEWHLSKSWQELHQLPIEESREISSVTSSAYFQVGHRKRIDFLKYAESQGLHFDLFGRDNSHGFSSYRGALPPYQKDAGLFPYRYTIACENSSYAGYATEKLWDGILAECLTFYWGCPNIASFIDSRAYVSIDLDDFPAALATIRHSITNNLWAERLPYIKQVKRQILDELNFFPRLERYLIESGVLTAEERR